MRRRHAHGIDGRLSAYASSTRATLSRKSSDSPAKRWIAYSAAAGAALTMGPAAEALPIYSGLQDISLTPGNAVGLDLDGNGVTDFSATLTNPPNIQIPQSNRVLLHERGIGTFLVQNLATGAPVSAEAFDYQSRFYHVRFAAFRRYSSGGCPGRSYPSASCLGFQPSITGFAGLRFKQSGQDLFGWMRLHVETSSYRPTAFLVKDWAYESEPGVGIEAGEGLTPVPEPGGLALLATGAVGIAAWRRRRSQARKAP